MTRLPIFLMAAAVSLTGTGLLADSGMQNVSGSDSKMSGDRLQQVGSTIADEKIVRDVQVLLSKVGNDGLTENSFAGLVSHLSKADRDRIGDFKNQKIDDLNRAISQFRADFKAKYHQDFDLRPEHFKDAMVYGGQDKNSATVSLSEISFLGKGSMGPSSKTVTDTTINETKTTGMAGRSDVTARSAGITDKSDLNNPVGNPASDSSSSALGNRTTADSGVGQNSNTVVRGTEAPASGEIVADNTARKNTSANTDTYRDIRTEGMPPKPIGGATLTLNLVNEGGVMNAWKIKIPDQIAGEQLKGNLIKHIQTLDDQKATWPTEASGAYHAAAFHVLQALNDSALATER
jgi:hypothetical protein